MPASLDAARCLVCDAHVSPRANWCKNCSASVSSDVYVDPVLDDEMRASIVASVVREKGELSYKDLDERLRSGGILIAAAPPEDVRMWHGYFAPKGIPLMLVRVEPWRPAPRRAMVQDFVALALGVCLAGLGAATVSVVSSITEASADERALAEPPIPPIPPPAPAFPPLPHPPAATSSPPAAPVPSRAATSPEPQPVVLTPAERENRERWERAERAEVSVRCREDGRSFAGVFVSSNEIIARDLNECESVAHWRPAYETKRGYEEAMVVRADPMRGLYVLRTRGPGSGSLGIADYRGGRRLAARVLRTPRGRGGVATLGRWWPLRLSEPSGAEPIAVEFAHAPRRGTVSRIVMNEDGNVVGFLSSPEVMVTELIPVSFWWDSPARLLEPPPGVVASDSPMSPRVPPMACRGARLRNVVPQRGSLHIQIVHVGASVGRPTVTPTLRMTRESGRSCALAAHRGGWRAAPEENVAPCLSNPAYGALGRFVWVFDADVAPPSVCLPTAMETIGVEFRVGQHVQSQELRWGGERPSGRPGRAAPRGTWPR